MRHACRRVLHKLLAMLRTLVIKFFRQTLHPHYILHHILGTLTSGFMRSSAAHASGSSGCHKHEYREQSRDADSSSVTILPSFYHPSESSHSVIQHSEHTRTDNSSTEEVESNHISVSIGTSLQDSTPLIMKPMTASDVRRHSKKSQMYVLYISICSNLIRNFISQVIGRGQI
jgi:hypothetical protein